MNRKITSIRLCLFLVASWTLMVGIPSIPFVRAWLVSPLHVHDAQAKADAAYVMAGGEAAKERLRAASDLFHQHRIEKIYVLHEIEPVGHNFLLKRNETRGELSKRQLEFYGVPDDRIEWIEPESEFWFSSFGEAMSVFEQLPESTQSIIVVTSAPHTRRSRLCFDRAAATGLKVHIFSASEPRQSAELFLPIWQEYAKYLCYLAFAR